ncbi:MAG: glycosyltransferase family 4 protein [Patescibacteria group bacterium]
MKKNKKHVLIICPFSSPNLGGVETHIDKLIRYATKKNYFVTLLTYQPLTRNVKGKKVEIHKNYEVHRVSWFGRGWFPVLEHYFPLVFFYMFPGLFFKSLIFYAKNSGNIDTIHAHGLVAALITKIITKFKKTNIVVSTHAVYRFGERALLARLVRWVLSDFNTVLAVSEVSRKELILLGLSKKKVKVHPNWIETDLIKPLNKKSSLQALNLKPGCHVLFVGRLIDLKGVELLLQSSKLLKEIHFHFVGNGPLESKVVLASKQQKNVTYHGVLMQYKKKEFEKLMTLYSIADFFVSPYLYDEGFSAALIESAAMGIPVVIPNRGSPPTFLSKDCAYFMSPKPTVDEVVKTLKNLCSTISNGKNTFSSDVCRKYAEDNFGSANADVITNSYA